MDHNDVLANLQEFLDGELEFSTVQLINSHLIDCNDCSGKFEMERLLKSLIRDKLVWRPAGATVKQDVLRMLA